MNVEIWYGGNPKSPLDAKKETVVNHPALRGMMR